MKQVYIMEEYEAYVNVIKMFTQYRGYKLGDKVADMQEFNSKLAASTYFKISAKNGGEPVLCFIFSKDCKYSSRTTPFKQLVSTIPDGTNIIMITHTLFGPFIQKAVASLGIHINNYKIAHFLSELPKGPLVPLHTILSPEEEKKLLEIDLKKEKTELPKILLSDPQVIWIGAKLNDVIKITDKSILSGHAIRYRVVVLSAGQVTFQTYDGVKEDKPAEDE